MKRIALILGFMLAGLAAFPQIKPIVSIEGGYEKRSLAVYKETPTYYFQESMFLNIDISAKWEKLLVYSYTCTYFNYRNITAYTPIQSEYCIGLKYNMGRFEINANHLCSHSIDDKRFRDGWNRISIKYQLIK